MIGNSGLCLLWCKLSATSQKTQESPAPKSNSMKTILILLAFSLVSCTTTTTTAPDGTVTKVEGIDKDALAAGSALAQTLAERNSGK